MFFSKLKIYVIWTLFAFIVIMIGCNGVQCVVDLGIDSGRSDLYWNDKNVGEMKKDSKRFSSCCNPSMRICGNQRIRDLVCGFESRCCSDGHWSVECSELAMKFSDQCTNTCGDGVCSVNGENCENCARDCGSCSKAGCQKPFPVISNISDPLLKEQWHLGMDSSHYHTNARYVWEKYSYGGNGVTISIVDDGVQWRHKDLFCNYDPSISFDLDRGERVVEVYGDDDHGTSCAGSAASGENGVCGMGASFRARLAGVRILGYHFSDSLASQGVVYALKDVDIYSNSWGPPDDGRTIQRFPKTYEAIKTGIKKGRNGLGAIYVWASGNGKSYGDNANYDELCNSPYTICVSASTIDGKSPSYSEGGANVFIAAPSGDLSSFGSVVSGIRTTDRMGEFGYHNGNCVSSFAGTSASAPVAAGAIGLVLEANPNLTWLDVQYILAITASKPDKENPLWVKNSAGLSSNPFFGFGIIDAFKAVEVALSFPTIPLSERFPLLEIEKTWTGRVTIPETSSDPCTITFKIDQRILVQHVLVSIDIDGGERGQIVLAVESPSETISLLAPGRGGDTGSKFSNFPFSSVQFMGELSNRDTSTEWKVYLHDDLRDSYISTLTKVKLTILGTEFNDYPYSREIKGVEGILSWEFSNSKLNLALDARNPSDGTFYDVAFNSPSIEGRENTDVVRFRFFNTSAGMDVTVHDCFVKGGKLIEDIQLGGKNDFVVMKKQLEFGHFLLQFNRLLVTNDEFDSEIDSQKPFYFAWRYGHGDVVLDSGVVEPLNPNPKKSNWNFVLLTILLGVVVLTVVVAVSFGITFLCIKQIKQLKSKSQHERLSDEQELDAIVEQTEQNETQDQTEERGSGDDAISIGSDDDAVYYDA